AALAEPEDLWGRLVAPRLDEEHVAHVFEEACRQFVARGTHPSLPFRPIQVGSWWSADSTEEVDVVALDGQGGLLVGECKWGAAAAWGRGRGGRPTPAGSTGGCAGAASWRRGPGAPGA